MILLLILIFIFTLLIIYQFFNRNIQEGLKLKKPNLKKAGNVVAKGTESVAKTTGSGIVNTSEVVGKGVVNTAEVVGKGIVNTAEVVGKNLKKVTSNVGKNLKKMNDFNMNQILKNISDALDKVTEFGKIGDSISSIAN